MTSAANNQSAASTADLATIGDDLSLASSALLNSGLEWPSNLPKPAAALFDMDGLLVDTEPVWFEVESAHAQQLGINWTEADQQQIMGTSLESLSRYFRRRAGFDESTWTETAQDIVAGMQQRYQQKPPEWMPGAKQALRRLRELSIPTALVSSSVRPMMDAVLQGLTAAWKADGSAVLDDLFDVTVAGDEVPHGKPHPQPYLHAAELLQVSADRCVVLEDSFAGAKSGLAAGCRVISVRPSAEGLEDIGTPGSELHHLASLQELNFMHLSR